ncbi:MAG: DUF4124 domain-containing protein [Xanthomonadaceae bacterium]|nr:DUF4124 domain-containing protein [Xanthomonadaceae bacterium]
MKTQTKVLIGAVLGTALAAASFTADAQQRYRWVDDNGTTRIADRIPPDVAGKRIEVLNARGMVVRVIEAELTDAQRADRAAERELEEERRVAREAQARRDRMLLDSYTTVTDLTNARDARLSSLEAQIRVSRDAADNLSRTVEDLAARVEAAGESPPVPLVQRLTATRDQLNATQRFLEAREKEQADIREQFTADIARFEQLRGSGQR